MSVVEQARRWLEADPDPQTRAELQALLDAGHLGALQERFAARLEFGTAGIRGALGAGPARMNRLVVRRVTAGVAAHLLERIADVRRRGVVVGRDARHGSQPFAADAAGVFAAAGIPVRIFDGPVPTPLVAYAVRALGAAAGVQVTASHNPATDNGYKVYWQDGAQIAPPLDAEISAAIDAADPAPAVADLGDPLITPVDPHIYPDYVHAALRLLPQTGGSRELRIAYTPLHGVALDLLRGVLHAAGFRDLLVVEEQAEPDPDFPTTPFPNPEEPGVLDAVLDLAAQRSADLVLANDPDGDRIAVAVPVEDGWRVLTGDEVGCLLAEHLLSRRPPGRRAVLATTVVSSQLLARIAEHHGAVFRETLTGFKWLARVAAQAEADGDEFVLAYEQALGVMVGTLVRDKDGISAALAVADLAARVRADGRRLVDALDDLARCHGLHLTGARSIRLDAGEGSAVVRDALERLRHNPPTVLAGVPLSAVADYAEGARRLSDGSVEPLSTPAADLMALEVADGSRALMRPSGTEPLLKFYGEVIEAVGEEPVAVARRRAALRLERLLDGMVAAALPSTSSGS